MKNTERTLPTAAGEEALRCPRCDSPHTKFCYYNNYSRSQPRHFCKACKRYWTRGGTLRNVPVGGGCRKSKPAARPPRATGLPAPNTVDRTNSPSSALGLHLVRFDHAADLPHLRRDTQASPNRPAEENSGSNQGFLGDDCGGLSYYMEPAAAAGITTIQDNLFWPPPPEFQILPITDHNFC